MSIKGFTIVELLVVITVSGILMGVLFGPLNDLYTSNSNSIRKVIQTTDAHSALRSIQNNISLSTGFLSQSAITDPSTSAKWNSASGILITSNYATTADTSPGVRTLVLSASDGTTKLQNNYVYFVSNGTLYRRTLANTSSTYGGATIGQPQTCAAGYTDTVNCKAVDATIVKNVTGFTVQYYASPESTTTISDPTIASTVVLNITVQTGAGSNTITTSNSLRISHIN